MSSVFIPFGADTIKFEDIERASEETERRFGSDGARNANGAVVAVDGAMSAC